MRNVERQEYMIGKVQQYIKKYHLIEDNDAIVVGVSGGADSVCLLFMLLEIRKTIPLKLYVVHINHKIREEAGNDVAYVKALCKEKELPFFLVEEDVLKIAKEEHLSSEEAGRKVRYEAFEKIRMEQHANKIAVAHHKNDNAETVLFNLFRGSSMKGLSGIAPMRDHIIRPLLCVDRKEIEDYLRKRNISYCIDATNAEDTYTRNKIRNRVLPYVEEQICQNATTHISDSAEVIYEAELFLQKVTNEAYQNLVLSDALEKDKNLLKIDREGFLKLDLIIQKYLIMRCFHELAGSRKDITSRHVQSVLELFAKGVNKKVNLPYHIRAVSAYDDIKLEKRRCENWEKEKQSDMETEELSLNLSTLQEGEIRTLEIPAVGKAEIRVFPYEKSRGIPEKTYTKWFDYDKIGKSLLIRHRQIGDYLSIDQENHTKTLKEYMIHEKIPQDKRDSLYAVMVENHVAWLIGYRISHYFKVSQDTKEILEVHIIGGNDNGRTCESNVDRRRS